LPTVRALVARDLIETHGLTQRDAAKRLGMTQPAISQYKRELRGKKRLIEDREVLTQIKAIAAKIASGELNPVSATFEFCEICKLVRKKKLICNLHMASLSVSECKICEEFNCQTTTYKVKHKFLV